MNILEAYKNCFTDSELEYIYSGNTVVKVDWNPSKLSGWVDLEREDDTITENFVINSHNHLTFDKWFPPQEYNRICKVIWQTREEEQ